MASMFDLREGTRRLNRVDLRKADYNALLKRIQALTDDMRLVVGKTVGQETFFRARRGMTAKPTLVTELAAPPAHLVTGYQRCNPPGVPMFYGASRRSTALLEIHAEAGDTVYLSQWMGHKEIPFNRIFDDTLEENWKQLADEKSHFLHAFFETLFTRRIHAEFSDDYKLTAAIAQHLTTAFPLNERHDIHKDATVALRFPSVTDIDNSYNFAMHPDFASERLGLLHVMELRIDTITENAVTVAILDTAHEIEGTNIKWSGDPEAYPARRTKGVMFRFDGKVWRIGLQNSAHELQWSVADMIAE